MFKPSDHNSNRGSLTIKDWFKAGHGYNHKIEQIVDKNGRKLILDKLETHFNGTQKLIYLVTPKKIRMKIIYFS